MKNKTLAKTNSYIKSPKKRRSLVLRSVKTSSAVEGVSVDLDKDLDIHIPRRPKQIYKNFKK